MTRGFLSTTEIESRFFFSAFPPAWRVIINEKNGRSLSLSLQYSSISDLGREIETHDARTLIVPLLVSLHASYLRIQMISPSLPLLRGWFLSRGEKRRGGRAHFARYPFVPDEKIRMKHRALSALFIHKRGVSIRPEVVPVLSSRRVVRSSL